MNARLARAVGSTSITTVLMAGVAIFAALAFAPAVGCRATAITGGSMEPAIPVGSAALVCRTAASDVEPGDVITFRPMGADRLVTHRVVTAKVHNGERWFQTMGDANATPDANLAPATAVVGEVRVSLGKAGVAIMFLQSRLGLLAVVGLPSLLVALSSAHRMVGQVRTRCAWKRGRRWLVAGVAAATLSVATGTAVHVSGASFSDTSPVGGNEFRTHTFGP